MNITVRAANDAPSETVPTAQSTAEDTALVFSSAIGNASALPTWTAARPASSLALNASNGTVTLGSTSGLTITGGRNGSMSAITFTGTLTDLNAALNGLIFTPTPDYNGPAGVAVTANDLGNTGAGGADRQ